MRQARQAKELIRVSDERGEALTLPSGSAYPAGCRISVETGPYRASIATAGSSRASSPARSSTPRPTPTTSDSA